VLKPEQEYSEYTDRYINWNGLIEEIKACINAVGGAPVVNSSQYEDSWRGLQLGLSQLRAQLQQFADSVNTNVGAAQSLSSQKGLPNGIASLDGNAKLLASQLPATSPPTAAQVGAISTGEKGTANGVASLNSNGIVPTAQLPAFEPAGTASGTMNAHTSALDPHSQYATDIDLLSHTGSTSNPHATTAAQVGAIASTEKATASGVATLAADGFLTSAQVRNPTTGGWVAATLLNGWTNFGNGFANAEYRLWSDGWVELRGLIARATPPAAASDILILPVGYRPSQSIIYPANGTHLFAAIYLLSSGELKYQSGSTTFLSIAIPPFKV
jgi:hypothetical protein